jgi:hypothetical protein
MMLRPLFFDFLSLFLPLISGCVLVFLGGFQAKLPRMVNALFLVLALATVVGGTVSAANLFPDTIHEGISYLGGATILLSLAALMLLGFAWSAPNRRFTNSFLITLMGICFVLLAIDGSGPLYWRFGAAQAWDRYPDGRGWLRQSSGVTCSPTAAAMLLYDYGIQVSEGEMAYLAGTSLFGSDGPAMARAIRAKVQDLGWTVHIAKTNLEEVTQRKVPFLAHIRGQSYGHAVVVMYMSDDVVDYLDPAHGQPIEIPIAAFLKVWDQTAIWIEKPPSLQLRSGPFAGNEGR